MPEATTEVNLAALKPAELIKSIQKLYSGPSKTFNGQPPAEATIRSWGIVQYLLYIVTGYLSDGRARNVHFIGPSGIGKTATISRVLRAIGIQTIIIPAANSDPTNAGLPILVPLPEDEIVNPLVTESVQYRLRQEFLAPGYKIILVDEKATAPPMMNAIFMEMEQEQSLGGVKITDLMGMVELDNPSMTGYGDLSELDLAQADRVSTVVIHAGQTPWEYGLAMAHPDLDLTRVIDLYRRLPLDVENRELFSPRVLDHVLTALESGLNAIYGWPIYPTERMKLMSRSGTDIRDETLDAIAEAAGLANPPRRDSDFKTALRLAATKGLDVLAYSNPGIGKTSSTLATLAEIGINTAYFSMPNVEPDEFNYTVPSRDGTTVTMIPRGEIWNSRATVGVYDEVTRGTPAAQNAINEIVNQHSCGGLELPNYVASVLLSNLSTAGGLTMDVNELTIPFATRPVLNFVLTAEDTGAIEYLVSRYGDDFVPFAEWWKMDLNDELRTMVSPRCLERMYDHYVNGLDMTTALPYLNRERVPVPLDHLMNRLSGRPQVSFLNLVNEIDDYERMLAAIDDPTIVKTWDTPGESLRMEVHMALMNAELPTLRAHREVCERLIRVLGTTWRTTILQTNPEKWEFWTGVLHDAVRLAGEV